MMKLDAAVAQAALAIAAVGLVGVGGVLFLWPVLLWVAPIIVAIELGKSRQRSGWMWGFFLGWLGVLILAIMKPVSRTARA